MTDIRRLGRAIGRDTEAESREKGRREANARAELRRRDENERARKAKADEITEQNEQVTALRERERRPAGGPRLSAALGKRDPGAALEGRKGRRASSGRLPQR